MDDPQFQQHGGPHAAEHRPHRRPIHHTLFFWIAASFLLAAMATYVLTSNLSSAPGTKPVPAALP
ncbi:MAG: hypothetical protein PSW75_05935 [bacterium]|nr:hypothetical protein [bacterium]MDI1335274.1 hypothetical protein [Lacunisphaera sp.]